MRDSCKMLLIVLSGRRHLQDLGVEENDIKIGRVLLVLTDCVIFVWIQTSQYMVL